MSAHCRVRLLQLDSANGWVEEVHDLTPTCPRHQPRVVTSSGVYINGENSAVMNPLSELCVF